MFPKPEVCFVNMTNVPYLSSNLAYLYGLNEEYQFKEESPFNLSSE